MEDTYSLLDIYQYLDTLKQLSCAQNEELEPKKEVSYNPNSNATT
jgi:hypothetical protein